MIDNKKVKPNRRTVAATIRGSVPDGKLKRAHILLSDASYGDTQVTGFTEYGSDRKTVVRIGAPVHDNAVGIVVRGHETRHATRHRLTRAKPMSPTEMQAAQIVDDVNIETTALPHVGTEALTGYRRAHIAVALTDFRHMLNDKRKVEANEAADTRNLRNARLLGALRAKAILQHYGKGHDDYYEGRTGKQARRNLVKMANMLGADTSKALNKIIALAKKPHFRARAISMLAMLLEAEPKEEFKEAEEGPMAELGIVPDSPVEGSAIEGHMTVKELRPRSVYTAKERKVSVIHAPDGVHINPTRYVSAIVSNDANGLFMRRLRRKPGGTVLIDASGSMGVNAYVLTKLLKLIPMATVAYYSGHDGSGKGQLSIYGKEGKRFSGELPSMSLMGGNAIDLPAVKWLFRQPKPWHLVTDMGFVGGVIGSEIIAKALVERAKARHGLTVHQSLDAAYEAFGGKDGLTGRPKRRPYRPREEDYEGEESGE